MYEHIDLAKYDVSEERGFLPKTDPLMHLPESHRWWEELAAKMPALLAAGKFGDHLGTMPQISAFNWTDDGLRLTLVRLSFLAHGYMRECQQKNISPIRIPPCVGVPLAAVAKQLGLPPVLSYAPYGLYNWRRLNLEKPVELGNLAVLQNFLGGMDESWFILVHVEIEAHAGRAIVAAVRAQEAAARNDLFEVARQLRTMAVSQERMLTTLRRMPEGCDPYIYYNRVRPYLFVPENVVFEDVLLPDGTPRPFRGETGAQSSIAPLFDAVLGVIHEPSDLSTHLREMRWYMPPKHRALLEEVENRKPVREVVRGFHEALGARNECLELLAKFRETHYKFATIYIHKQARMQDGTNPTDVGTGRTRFMLSLRKHVDETREAML